MNYKIIAGAFCLLAGQTSYGMESENLIQDFFDRDFWRNRDVIEHDEKKDTEEAIIELIENGKNHEAKKIMRRLFYGRMAEKRPTAELICAVIYKKADEDVLSMIIEKVAKSELETPLLYETIDALTYLLPIAVKNGFLYVIEKLDFIFQRLYENRHLHSFRQLDEEAYKKNMSLGTYAPILYNKLCHTYLAAFDEAAYQGNIRLLVKFFRDSPCVCNHAHSWSHGKRSFRSNFKSALAAAWKGRNREMLRYLLKEKAGYNVLELEGVSQSDLVLYAESSDQ